MSSITALILASLAAQGSIIHEDNRWPTDETTGETRVPVCIVSGSSAEQSNGAWLHASNPSLDEVIDAVRYALDGSWELWSSVRFVGWDDCDNLTEAEQDASINLYIHPDASNSSSLGYPSAATGTTQFKPWGNGGVCIAYDAGTVRMEYSFDCVEQYAIHEFGHAIGFEHEWRHPLTPEDCSGAESVLTSTAGYIIPNETDYDWDSIMVYDDACADVTGVRFGSTNLSVQDIYGVQTAYPPEGCNPETGEGCDDPVSDSDEGGSGCDFACSGMNPASLPLMMGGVFFIHLRRRDPAASDARRG